MLKALLAALPQQPRVSAVVSDVEAAIWSAVREVLPGPRSGASRRRFPFGPVVWCSVQAVGLQSAYTAYEEINRICRKTLALTFLPADVIPATFLALEGANTDGLVDQHRPTCGWSQLFGHHQRGQSTASLSELTVIAKAGIITSTLKPATVG